MKLRMIPASVAVVLSVLAVARGHEMDRKAEPVVQIALLLDTSNSMDGLINQARTQLWKVVNEFNRCKRDGVAPKLQVALYEYGNNSLAAGEGYVRMVLPLTNDLDLVSEKLWALTTNGGSEYCGQVIKNAAAELNWSADKRAYKAIFIAGNEPFTQGNVDYRVGCAEALAKGIIINTIHCGPENVGRDGKWADGARLGEGRFLNIDQDRVCAVIVTPHDAALSRLSSELNKTYIPFGARGETGYARQTAQDAAAEAAPASGAVLERAAAKASSNYNNAGWDLVDAIKEKKAELSALKDEELPNEMRSLSPEQREVYVKNQSQKRTDIQKQIAALNDQRAQFIAAEEKKQSAATDADTLDSAMLKAVREQLNAKDFKTE